MSIFNSIGWSFVCVHKTKCPCASEPMCVCVCLSTACEPVIMDNQDKEIIKAKQTWSKTSKCSNAFEPQMQCSAHRCGCDGQTFNCAQPVRRNKCKIIDFKLTDKSGIVKSRRPHWHTANYRMICKSTSKCTRWLAYGNQVSSKSPKCFFS